MFNTGMINPTSQYGHSRLHGLNLSIVIIGLISIFMMTGILYIYGTGVLYIIGYGSMLAVLLLAQVLLFTTRRFLPRKILSLLILSSAFVITNLIGLAWGVDTRAITTVVQAYLIFGFMLSMSLVTWTDKSLKVLAFLFCSINIVINVYILGYKALYNSLPFEVNPNVIGAINFYLSFQLISGFKLSKRLLARLYYLTGVLFTLLNILFVANARSILVAGFVAIIIFFAWPYLTKNPSLYRSSILLMMTGIIGFTYLYNQLAIVQRGFQLDLESRRRSNLQEEIYRLTGKDISQLNDLVLEKTSKSLFSGRDNIWPYLVYAIERQPILGYGPSALPNNFLPSTSSYRGLSSHSFYIQISLQTGLLGLVIFVLIMYQIWKIFWIGRSDPIVRLAGAFCFSILIHQAFEVSLTQNILLIGIFQWLILAVGISRSIYFGGAPHQRRTILAENGLG